MALELSKDALAPNRMELATPLGPRAPVVLLSHEQADVPMLYNTYLRKSVLKAKTFFNMDEAAKWLGISPEAVP